MWLTAHFDDCEPTKNLSRYIYGMFQTHVCVEHADSRIADCAAGVIGVVFLL